MSGGIYISLVIRGSYSQIDDFPKESRNIQITSKYIYTRYTLPLRDIFFDKIIMIVIPLIFRSLPGIYRHYNTGTLVAFGKYIVFLMFAIIYICDEIYQLHFFASEFRTFGICVPHT